jgi:large subunit ribosomal protein L18
MPFDKSTRNESARTRVKRRLRSKIQGTAERPRLLVFKSAKHMYAHIIDDVANKTLLGISTLNPSLDLKEKRGLEKAAAIGKAIAEKAKAAGIEMVVFDRNGYKYHGRIKAVADGAREGGLNF